MNRKKKRSVLLLAICSAAASGPVGCASGSKETPALESGGAWIGAESAPSSVLTVRDAYPFVGLQDDEPVPGVEVPGADGALISRWEVLAGEHSGRVIRAERTPDGPRTWRVRSVIEETGEVLEVRVLRFDESTGSLVLLDTEQTDRGVRVVMRPEPNSMPAELPAAETVTQEMSLRMPYLKDPRRLRTEGRGVMTLEYDADQTVTVNGKALEARRVREVFTTNVTAAKAVRTINRWFVPGLGMVAERWDEEVRVLGLTSERTERTVRLLKP